MIHVLAIVTTQPGQRGVVLDAVRDNLAAVRAEDGCIEYGPVIDADGSTSQSKLGDDTFVVVEKWESLEALAAHAASAHMVAYANRVSGKIASRQIHVLTPAP